MMKYLPPGLLLGFATIQAMQASTPTEMVLDTSDAATRHLRRRLQSELQPGESIVWMGQPSAERCFRQGFKLWLFFVPWAVLSLWFLASWMDFSWPRFDNGWALLYPLLLLPYLVVALGGLWAPVWLRYRARSTLYAITTTRVLLLDGTRTDGLRVFLPPDIVNITCTVYTDGLADLVLGEEQYLDSDNDRQIRKLGFFAIANVRRVEQLLEALLERQATDRAPRRLPPVR